MDFVALKKTRAYLIGGAAVAALSISAGSVWAQTAETPTSGELETVVVSSTRLQNAGFDAPTPTQVLNSDDLARVAQPNVFDAVIQLPALQGSTGQTYEVGSTSTGLQGLSAFSLRGFSPLRTLTLVDGERVIGANYNQVVDVSLLPQMLIQRVDVVTGGASASWGSDAVAGVVNFVTDKKFEGFKVDASYGETRYDDNKTATIKFAAGTSFLGGRGHIEVAADYENDEGVVATGPPATNFGCQMPGGRNVDDCSGTSSYGSAKATPAGQPEVIWGAFAQGTQEPAGGMIISGPLHGTAFGANGSTYPFNFAGGGVPSLTSTSVIGCPSAGTCISTPAQPGDLTASTNQPTVYQPVLRQVFFTRMSFDITDRSEIFATFNYGNSNSNSEPTTTFGRNNLAIACNNAYLPAATAAACTADYPSGTMTFGIGAPFSSFQNVNIDRLQRRFVLGGDGAFTVMGKDWSWDTYAEYAEAPQYLRIQNMPLVPNLFAAINAVAGTGTGAGGNGIPVGQIGCAYAPARAAGCQPYDILGTGVTNTAAAMSYIIPPNGPYADTSERQEAFGATLNMKPLTLWAGDLSVAVGVDYRLENFHLKSDPYGNGLTVPVADPNTSAYPPDPAICNCNFGSFATDLTAGGAWYAGNYHEGGGQYTVDEVFAETGIPLYKVPGWGGLDADLGARFEHYSQSGNWTTWKIGLVWDTPAPGVRIRALESEDLRAPNLSEIYTPPISINNAANDPFLPGSPSLVGNQITAGNLLLTPETSKTQEVGIVFQPEYLPGLRASVDYYHIDVNHIIQSIGSPQTVVNNCAAGGLEFCGQAFIPTVGAVPYNLGGIPIQYNTPLSNDASVVTSGVDLESSYQFKLDNWGIPGNFALRALGTKTYKWTLCPNLVGAVCTNNAGALGNYTNSGSYNSQGGTIPTWKVLYAEDYSNTWGTFTLMQRWFNAGYFSNNNVQCNPGSCPVQTAFQAQNYPTTNFNHMPGAIYWDAGASFNVMEKGQLYLKVNNIANKLPPPSAGGVNGTIYDVLGTMYYIGIRYSL